jgi:hypothetical protein
MNDYSRHATKEELSSSAPPFTKARHLPPDAELFRPAGLARWQVERRMLRIIFYFVLSCCLVSMFVYCGALRKVEHLVGVANATSSWEVKQSEDGGFQIAWQRDKEQEQDGEAESTSWSPSDAVYFVATLFLGNGYGDVTPTSLFGRAWAVCLMLLSIPVAGAVAAVGLSDLVRQRLATRARLRGVARRRFADACWRSQDLAVALMASHNNQ